MQEIKINPLVQWWVTPKLPYHDIYNIPLLINKSRFAKYKFLISQWTITPIKRRLARVYLKFLQKNTDIKVIAITGSAGKTTTKEMLYSILKKQAKTVCTETFIDSVYNIPNTILKTTYGTKYLILEMGVEYPGEMDFYLWLAKPDVGVITNIFPTHLEFLESKEGVFNEKKKLVYALDHQGIAVLNSDDKNLKTLEKKLKCNVVWFKADSDPRKQNANTARAIAESIGILNKNIKFGLSNYRNPEHRLTEIHLKNGALLFDDTYNSNPLATISALRVFSSFAKNRTKIAVLGEMRELGNFEKEAHEIVARKVTEMKFNTVIGIGKATNYLIDEVKKRSKKIKTYHVESVTEAYSILKLIINSQSAIFVKGSRSLGLDKLVAKLS